MQSLQQIFAIAICNCKLVKEASLVIRQAPASLVKELSLVKVQTLVVPVSAFRSSPVWAAGPITNGPNNHGTFTNGLTKRGNSPQNLFSVGNSFSDDMDLYFQLVYFSLYSCLGQDNLVKGFLRPIGVGGEEDFLEVMLLVNPYQHPRSFDLCKERDALLLTRLISPVGENASLTHRCLQARKRECQGHRCRYRCQSLAAPG